MGTIVDKEENDVAAHEARLDAPGTLYHEALSLRKSMPLVQFRHRLK
jgi:hypothetical protein